MRAVLFCAVVALLAYQPAPPPRTVLAVGTALDGRGGVLRNTRLVIQDGKIAAIDPEQRAVDIDLRYRVTSCPAGSTRMCTSTGTSTARDAPAPATSRRNSPLYHPRRVGDAAGRLHHLQSLGAATDGTCAT